MLALKKTFSVTSTFFFTFYFLLFNFCSSAQKTSISSPDKKIQVVVEKTGSAITYRVIAQGTEVIHPSKLGLATSKGDLSANLQWKSVSPASSVNDQYELFTGKKKKVSYKATRQTISLTGENGLTLGVVFQVSNDGVAFRYSIGGFTGDSIVIDDESTQFTLDMDTKGFLQPMQTAKTGFEQTNPAYEDNYRQNIVAGTASPSGQGWVYPALFQQGDRWILLTEAGMDGSYCATRLTNKKDDPVYKVSFPDPREIMYPGGLLPKSAKAFNSPWRVIVVGSLATIMESTLGTDVAAPAITMNMSIVKPGFSSWSWIMSKDDSIVYSEQKRYIDFAADMNWQYCLVDANWDKLIGYDKMKELADYAKTRKVGMLLWYNSAGDWNTVKMTPKSMLLTREARMTEFTRIKNMGIKGVKIDFFGGDGRSVIQYYIDILKDAAEVGLLVNFHGATLPRGWSRTYPNFVTAEAVKGFEMITFNQRDADIEANHGTMLPFTRNVFDPMDFTPMNLYKIGSRVQRKTTSAFELATSVIYLSGIQHFAESPAGMTHVPEVVKNYLRKLPTRWDEVKFIEGFPGKHVVIARRAGTKWYIAGMNGEQEPKTIQLDMNLFKKKKASFIGDGDEQLSFSSRTGTPADFKTITMKSQGGFVLVLE